MQLASAAVRVPISSPAETRPIVGETAVLVEFRPLEYRVVTDRGAFNVTAKEHSILELLTGARGRAVTHGALVDAANQTPRPITVDCRNIMKRLRAKGVDIVAEYGVGYRLRPNPEVSPLNLNFRAERPSPFQIQLSARGRRSSTGGLSFARGIPC